MRALLSTVFAALVTAGPASAGGLATYVLEIRDGRFTPQRLEVPAGERFKIIVKNVGTGPIEFESVPLRVEKALSPGTRLAPFANGSPLELALGVPCFLLLQQAGKAAGWRAFFKASQWLLVLLGGAMLMSGLDRAIGQLLALELPSPAYALLGDTLWDSSALLDDGSRAGALLAGFTGYRAMPTLPAVVLLGAYWLLAWRLLRPAPALRPRPPHA